MDNKMNGRMQITVVGSGTCVPSLRRSACSVLIETDDQTLLCDIGPGTMRRLLEKGTTIHKVTHILLSHFHPDHTGELASFLFANKYPKNDSRRTPLTLIGATGCRSFYNRLQGVYGEWITFPPEILTLTEVSDQIEDTLTYDAWSITTIPVAHRPESVAYRITGSSGRSVVYSGDTDFSENLISLAYQTDLLVCESAHPDGMKVNGHLTPSLAGEIASRADVKKLMLIHFYPECNQTDILAQCRRTFKGETVVAEDLMTVCL